MMSTGLPQLRAVRNNNPGNIRKGADWVGLMPAARMTPEQAHEKDFCVFETAEYGFRALALTLLAYEHIHQLWTPREWVTRWAPPNENNTPAYLAHFCNLTGFDPDLKVDLYDIDFMCRAARAFAVHESGGWLFNNADLQAGCALALLNYNKATV